MHFTEWAVIEMEQAAPVGEVVVHYWTGSACEYKVEYKQSGSWTVACTLTASSGGQNTCADFPSSESLSEIRVYKNPSAHCGNGDDCCGLAISTISTATA